MYTRIVPKLWRETVAAHRREVRDAILDATVALVGERGPTAVTMSEIAEATGIGRATLYKYFPDVESILTAWHDRQIDQHLQELVRVRDQTTGATQRLEAVLTAYVKAISHRRPHDNDIAGMLHRSEHVAAAHQQLREFIRELIADAA